MKKVTIVELSVLLIALLFVSIYYSPLYRHKQEAMFAAKIKADNSVFISKVLEEAQENKDLKSSQIAQKVVDELNTVSKNPYNKNSQAYTFETSCKACNSIEYDDEMSMIILSSYNKAGELMAKVVIKPPSYVTYTKNDKS